MRTSDWPAVRAIHEEGIATGDASFEQTVLDRQEWDRKHLPVCRLVARCGQEVVGWAAVCPVFERDFYSGVAEDSVYVKQSHRGRGIGKRLLKTLIQQSEQNGIWTLQALIFPENEVSIALHVALGFRLVGRRERLGQMNGVWRDVLLMERRSRVVGV